MITACRILARSREEISQMTALQETDNLWIVAPRSPGVQSHFIICRGNLRENNNRKELFKEKMLIDLTQQKSSNVCRKIF